MAMTTRMMIYAFLLYGGIFAAIVAVIARVINISSAMALIIILKNWHRTRNIRRTEL